MRARHAVLLIVTGVVVVGARLVFAQPATEITVDELVARALADNPDLKAVRADADAAVGRVRQAGLRPNPMLELGGQKALSPDNNLTVGLSLPLDLRSEEHTSELQSLAYLVCRLLLEKKKTFPPCTRTPSRRGSNPTRWLFASAPPA